MITRVVNGITIRPLRNGETRAVQAVFDRLGPQSRLMRFGGAEPVLTERDLDQLARVDGGHHVLLALVDGEPIGIARLLSTRTARRRRSRSRWSTSGRDGVSARCCRSGFTSDARAAGIERLHAYVVPENAVSRRLMRRSAVHVSFA